MRLTGITIYFHMIRGQSYEFKMLIKVKCIIHVQNDVYNHFDFHVVNPLLTDLFKPSDVTLVRNVAPELKNSLSYAV